MLTTLTDTTAADIQAAITEGRHRLGASGMVLTLVVMTTSKDVEGVLDSCTAAAREHPSRILVLTSGSANTDRLDAEIHLGEDIPGEVIVLHLNGAVARHRESVVLPLLLPDSPVVAWWPDESPTSLVDDAIGKLAIRRISDAMGAQDPVAALATRAAHLTPGDTDLTWTRLTLWRGLIAAALDQVEEPIEEVVVDAEADTPAAQLLAAWLDDRLGCPVRTADDAGPGINAVTLTTPRGDVRITRTDGRLAALSAPGTPCRSVALRRRTVTQLLTEELRRLGPDTILASAMARLLSRGLQQAAGKAAMAE